jgi:hypothetical protein
MIVGYGKGVRPEMTVERLAALAPAYGTVAGPGPSLLQPANAIRDALRRDGSLKAGDLDLIEINERSRSTSKALT